MAFASLIRPVQMPVHATRGPGTPNRGYTFVEGAALSTDDGDVEILMDEYSDVPIIP
jgi:hypothetical protein